MLPQSPEGKTGWPWCAETGLSGLVGNQAFPSITLVTPSFNQGDFLEETIRSVLFQDYPNLQYIVVDGGSTDKSQEVLDKYAPYISHVIREPDAGQSDAICKGLDLATGTFFNWINSDDLLLPGVLNEVGRRFNDSHDLYTFRVLATGKGVEPYTMENHNLSAKAMLRCDRYSFSQPGLWFRTAKVRECGGIDRNFNYGFDWDLLVRYLSANPRVYSSSTTGAVFRLHPDSKTVQETSKTETSESRFWQESQAIRLKIEQTLAEPYRQASLLGRKREPWNQYLVELLDAPGQSPLMQCISIVRQVAKDPRVRCSSRTAGSILRLLSRYVRPQFYRHGPDASK